MKLNIPFYKADGSKQEALVLEIADKFSEINTALISQAIYVENSNSQVKAGKTKTKSEIRGGGRKPWKQKGTGRARAGSNRSPLWRGGGVTFGPTGENRSLDIPKKMREKAILTLLFNKVKQDELAVIENIKVESGKTKDAKNVFDKISDSKFVVLAIDEQSTENTTSWRNIPVVDIKKASELLINDINSKKKIIFTRKAFEGIEARATK